MTEAELKKNDLNAVGTPPTWFTVVAWVAVAWNVLGLLAFFVEATISAEALAQLPEDQQKLYADKPSWLLVPFAVAVFCGTIGAVLLALKKKPAVPVLVLSLVGVLIQYGYMFFATDTVKVMGLVNLVLPILVVLISIALVRLGILAKNSGWLK